MEGNKNFHQSTYEKAYLALDRKREKAFRLKDISKWELKIEDLRRSKDLLDNKDEAYKAMFPKDQAELRMLKDNYHFFINHSYKEIRRTNRYDMLNTHVNYIKL